jgi:threonine dehydratase
MWSIQPSDIEHALTAVRRHALVTPLVPAPKLGPDVWLKLESEQRTGSFKLRGALAKLASLDDGARARPIVTASAGNHGLGVAEACMRVGFRARIYVSKRTPYVKRDGMTARGAEVIVTDALGYDETERIAREAAERDQATFVSAFDDPLVAAGNGTTVGLEILDALSDIDAIVAPVGGGGLMAGLAAARARTGRDSVRLIGVQSEACPAMKRSIDEGRAILALSAEGETLAEGLEGGVTESTFASVRDAVERIDLVSERDIADAMRFAKTVLGRTVEGSAATVIAWARAHAEALAPRSATVLIVTGRNVDAAVLERVLA